LTYVNFVLVQSPLMISVMTLGFVCFVFLPSIVTTLLAGRAVARLTRDLGCGVPWRLPPYSFPCC
jgi:hypothetical protein